MVQTKLEPLSEDFTIESVALREPHAHGGDHDQPAHEHDHERQPA
jgi:hypothetical protein